MSRSLILADPPIYPDDDDDEHPDPPPPPPASILLDPRGYIDGRTNNATTAEGVASGGERVRVTFWASTPPRFSCFTVSCPDLDEYAFGGVPMVLCTEAGLALLRVPICALADDGVAWNNDHFVYHAGGGGEDNNKPPSLDLVPRPPSWPFMHENPGLLRCRRGGGAGGGDGDEYFIALLCWALQPGKYKLHLFSSETATWSCRPMSFSSPELETKVLYTYSNKVIAIGGELGSMAWVDLWRGMLICDVLRDDDSDELRYIPLPPPLLPRTLRGPPLFVRDIIAVEEGCIKYFEMILSLEGWWKAATWERKDDDSWSEWNKEYVIQIPKDDDPAHTNDPDLMQEAETNKNLQPTLKGLCAGYPALSHHDDGVVYIMDMHSHDDTNVTVLAVYMREQTVKSVAEYCPPRPLRYKSVYLGSDISKHLCSTRGKFATEADKHETLQFGS